MYKLVVLTDPESAVGFRLAGVDVVEAVVPEDVKKKLISLINDDTAGIVAVNEDLMNFIDSRMREKIDNIYRPIVVSIPVVKKMEITPERREYIASLIRRAVGFEIKLRTD